MASSDNEDYNYSDDDNNDDYDCSEYADDEVCQSDDDGACPEELDVTERRKEPLYVLEIEDDVRQRQDAAVKETTDLLLVPRGYAAALLRRCQWDPEQLRDEWFVDNGHRMCDTVGLPAADGFVHTMLNDLDLTCAICFDAYGPGDMRSAACAAHFYCHECWRGYIHAAVGDGARCLSLRCPHPGCKAAVVRELVDDVAEEEDRQRYATFFVRSFVEEGKNKLVRWCPGAGCTRAVWSNIGLDLYEVSCECNNSFCFRCGEEAHSPASCDTAREWMAKNSSDGDTMNWVLVNTKHCPKCRRAIEKNQGCMHMTCGDPCRHEFCWLCLGPWTDHEGGDFYSCNRYRERAHSEFSEAEQRKSQAKASLERYLHFYERFTAYGDSRKKARADLDGLLAGGLDEFAEAMGVPPTELDFLKKAYEQVIECRRVLQWTYAYVYYLDQESDAVKLHFIEYLQSEAEVELEKLHDCGEERQKVAWEATSGARDPAKLKETFNSYKEKLVTLSGVMRNNFSNLVKGFEDGLAEVVA